MSYPFNNRSYNCNQSMNNYGSPYNYNNYNNNGYGGNQMSSYYGGYPSGMQMQMQPQQQQMQPQIQQMTNPGNGNPHVNILPAGQELDPNMKVIKLNWGDLLGSANGGGNGMQNGGHGLKVSMVGGNGDISGRNTPGLRCTLNGQVPQNSIVHVMNINPYQNIL